MFRRRPTRDELEQLRVHEGDAVVCDGRVCTVVACGLRYLRLESLDHAPLGLVRRDAVRRVDAAEAQSQSPLDELGSTEPFDYNSLLTRTTKPRR
jgi:hypothetical protein